MTICGVAVTRWQVVLAVAATPAVIFGAWLFVVTYIIAGTPQ